LVERKMDIAELVRDEWSTLVLLLSGVGGVLLAISRGEWHWAAVCFGLIAACLRIFQLTGWIPNSA